ncbi:MAG: phosphotransferase family protein [Acidobacteria bacterium]|nr:phosphotransferase family protein [Acidobacteriota bacterium]MCW5949649.1 phosphotransferase family protein [Pyrinomonadaceae bacterium]
MPETLPVRPGEELDIDRLRLFVAGAIGPASDVKIEQFTGGSSNLTYLITINGAEYVLRRPPFGNTIKTAHDMRREFEVLSKLSHVYSPAPKPLYFCDDANVIGSEFYLMERRKGLIIRGLVTIPEADDDSNAEALALAKAKQDLETSQAFRREVCISFTRNLAGLHALDLRVSGLADLGKPVGYNRRQVEGWTKRYIAAKTHELVELEKAIRWLNDHIPPESGASLIHNDYKFDNIMLDPNDLTRITAVLDWEMVTVGDPLMDLGTTLGYWMSPDVGDELINMPFNPRVLMENVTRRELVEMYIEASGRDLPDILFYYVFGTFKIAVIAQQIYARYVRGSTKDKRFAEFDRFVAALGRISADAIKRGSL